MPTFMVLDLCNGSMSQNTLNNGAVLQCLQH